MQPDRIKSVRGFTHGARQIVKRLFNSAYLFEVLAEVAEGTAEPVIEEHESGLPGYSLPSNKSVFAYAVLETMNLIGLPANVTVGQRYHMTGYGRELYDSLRTDSNTASAKAVKHRADRRSVSP